MAAHEQTRVSPPAGRRLGAALSVGAGEGAASVGQTGVDRVHLALRRGEVPIRERGVGFRAQLVECCVGRGAFEVDQIDRDLQEVAAWRCVGRDSRDAVIQRLFYCDLIGCAACILKTSLDRQPHVVRVIG